MRDDKERAPMFDLTLGTFGDRLGIDFASRAVAFTIEESMHSLTCALPKDQVRKLRDELTRWLGEDQPMAMAVTREVPPKPMTTAKAQPIAAVVEKIRREH
jgi:hypothetical protein